MFHQRIVWNCEDLIFYLQTQLSSLKLPALPLVLLSFSHISHVTTSLTGKSSRSELEQLEIKLIHYVSPIHWLLVPVSVFEEEICLSYQNATFARYIFRSLKLYQRLSNMKNNVFEEIFLTNRVIGSWKPRNSQKLTILFVHWKPPVFNFCSFSRKFFFSF